MSGTPRELRDSLERMAKAPKRRLKKNVYDPMFEALYGNMLDLRDFIEALIVRVKLFVMSMDREFRHTHPDSAATLPRVLPMTTATG